MKYNAVAVLRFIKTNKIDVTIAIMDHFPLKVKRNLGQV